MISSSVRCFLNGHIGSISLVHGCNVVTPNDRFQIYEENSEGLHFETGSYKVRRSLSRRILADGSSATRPDAWPEHTKWNFHTLFVGLSRSRGEASDTTAKSTANNDSEDLYPPLLSTGESTVSILAQLYQS